MMRLCCSAVAVSLVLAMLGLSFAPAGAGEINTKQEFKEKIKQNEDYNPTIVPADFQDGSGNALPIDNAYWPLTPGTTFIYEGEGEDGVERNEVYVTHDTKVVMGVTCTVVLDREWVDGELTETTDDWYAQHKNGDIWYFGEDSDGGGSWEAGVNGAKPGILMLANPQPGESYRQEYLEGEAEDMAKVLRLNASAAVPHGEYDNCLETKEWTPLSPGENEHKYYAPGVGLVRVTELQGGQVHFDLIEITTE